MESLKKHGVLLDAESFSPKESTDCSDENLNGVNQDADAK